MSRLTDTLKRRTEIDLRGSLRVAAGSAVVLRWGRGQANWGDALNPVLAEYISGKPTYPYQGDRQLSEPARLQRNRQYS